MEIVTIKRSEKDQKQQIIELLKENNSRIIVMMSKAWFSDFKIRADVRRDMYEYTIDQPDEIIYEIYENERTLVCKYYGRMKFQLIGGLYFLETCDFLKYESSGDEASKIIFLEQLLKYSKNQSELFLVDFFSNKVEIQKFCRIFFLKLYIEELLERYINYEAAMYVIVNYCRNLVVQYDKLLDNKILSMQRMKKIYTCIVKRDNKMHEKNASYYSEKMKITR